MSGKWGIALRTVSGDYQDPEGPNIECWLFNDAPRSMRLLSIGKIPELLETLSKEATETTKKIKGKLAEAQQVAAVVKEAAGVRVSLKALTVKSPFDKESPFDGAQEQKK